MNLRLGAWARGAALAAAMAALAGASEAQTVLRLVPHADLKILDTTWTNALITRNHGLMVYDTLFALDSKMQPKPQMVESFSTSADGMTWTFKLRAGQKFHDGSPVTAADAVQSLRRWAARRVDGTAMMAAAKSLEAKDELTFELAFKDRFVPVLETLANPVLPTFVLRAKDAMGDPFQQQNWDEVVGSGPFTFDKKEWQPGAKVVYRKFRDYRGRDEAPDGFAGGKPVHVDVVERPPRSIAFGAAWSTDEGGMLNARWQHRNLLGGGEQLRLSAELSHLFVNSVEDFAGRVDAQLRLPDLLAPGLSLRLDAGAVRERLDAYDRDAMFAGAAVERRISRELVASLGGLVERSHVVQGDDERFYTLVSMPGTLEWDSSDDRLEPTRGWRLGGTLAPAKSFTDTQGGFASARGSARTYLDLGGTGGRSVLALRAGAGSILAGNRGDVPADRRFYAGGGGSVRGHAYQSIGPHDSRGQPEGGLSLLEGSVELRQRFGGNWGAALFADGGGAAATRTLGSADLRMGVGGGVRYYTPIGAIRLDLGLPIRPEPGASHFALYVGIGQAF